MALPYPNHREAAPGARGRIRDLTWGRTLFTPPSLPNPRVVFDPAPFRTQLFHPPIRVAVLPGR